MKEFIEKLIERFRDCTTIEDYGELFVSLDEVENIINELAEEYNNGWINADVESPTENGKYLVYYRQWTFGNYLPKFDETEIRMLRYRNNDWVFSTYGDTEAEKDINREVIAWQPLPKPYQTKGE